MAAVIELRTGRDLSDSCTSPARHVVQAPPLRIIHGGRSLAARRMRRTFLLRRVAVVVAAVLAVVVGTQVVGAALTPLPVAGAPAELGAVHRVAPGDTLWALATSVDPQADPRDVVDEIVALNAPGTPGSALDAELHLLAGRELRLPTDR